MEPEREVEQAEAKTKGTAPAGHQDGEPHAEESTHFTHVGAKPPVAHGSPNAPKPSASELAFGASTTAPHTPDDAKPHGHHAPRARPPSDQAVMASESDVDGAAIEEASAAYQVPTNEIRAIITQESRGDAEANAGSAQSDHGKHAASGLMQVTEESWKQAQHAHKELATYDFASYRYDRRVNILVGTAILAAKSKALASLGIDPRGPQIGALTSMAYNAGEGLVGNAYERARKGGSKHPDADCLKPEYLKPAIHDYPQVYSYYLTGGGKSRNPTLSVDCAVDLKFEEISRYPAQIDKLLAGDEQHHEAATPETDRPPPDQAKPHHTAPPKELAGTK